MIGAWKPRPPAPSVEERIEALETRMGLLATSLQDFGWRLAQLDRERLEELKRLRQDVDDLTLKADSQVYVNTDTHRRLGELEKALGTLLATKEPPAEPEPPPNTLTRAYAAVVLVQRLGYSWDGRSWEPTNSGPGYVSGAA